MRKRRRLASILAIMLTIAFALPAICGSPFTPPSVFQNKTDGTIVYAADWNNVIGGLYTYITGTLLPQLNIVTTLGDMYIFNGTSLARLPVGSNGQVLTSDSTQALGLAWEAGAGLPITTKGDLVVGNSVGSAARLPVGSNGKVLTADSTQTNGAAWEAVAGLNAQPGTIVMFYGPYGGAIPAGWVLCDGTNGTPNLIGMIVIGAQASGGSSSANPSGFGNSIENTVYGNTTHTHTYSGSVAGTTGGSTSNITLQYAFGSNTSGVATNGHVHAYSASYSGTTSSVSLLPACMGIQYMMKT